MNEIDLLCDYITNNPNTNVERRTIEPDRNICVLHLSDLDIIVECVVYGLTNKYISNLHWISQDQAERLFKCIDIVIREKQKEIIRNQCK